MIYKSELDYEMNGVEISAKRMLENVKITLTTIVCSHSVFVNYRG